MSRNDDKIDFTQQFDRAYNKFIYGAVASITISALDIVEEEFKFFGFTVENVNERSVEFAFFVIALFLSWNYLTRVFDERYKLNNIRDNLSRLRHGLEGEFKQFDFFLKTAPEVQSKCDMVVKQYKNALEIGKKNIEGTITEDEMNKNLELISAYIKADLRSLSERIAIVENLDYSKMSIQRHIDDLERIRLRSSADFLKRDWRVIRFWSINVIIPCVIFIVMCIFILFPDL